MMTVATATSQPDKALAGFLTTVFLLVSLSVTLRSIAKRLYIPGQRAEVVPAKAG